LRRAVASIDVLSPYPQLVVAGFRRHATYRQAALAGLLTNIVFGLLRAPSSSPCTRSARSSAGTTSPPS
jgi:ABC-2 type transport system permease protein